MTQHTTMSGEYDPAPALEAIGDLEQSTPNLPFTARLTALIGRLGSIIIPPVCVACQRSVDRHDALCPSCWSTIIFIGAPLCDRLGLALPFDTGGPSVSAAALANPPDFDRARAVAYHSGAMRRLVHGLKYFDRNEGRRLFGFWMLTAGHELLAETDIIVPVPLARRRLLSRRFNQSAELARELAHRSAKPYIGHALLRRRATAPQVGMTAAQRRQNVTGAFTVPKRHSPLVAGKNILLVDDVMTTGATAEACARSLKRAGANRVNVLTLSRMSGDILTPH